MKLLPLLVAKRVTIATVQPVKTPIKSALWAYNSKMSPVTMRLFAKLKKKNCGGEIVPGTN